MNLKHLLFLLAFPFFGHSQVDFIWVDSIVDDFSFTEKWDYQDGVYMNQWGQLSCDGLCPMEIDVLKDDQGRIYDDSLKKFYSIIDTTHRYFTHAGTVRAYEFGECNYAVATRLAGKIHVNTESNISTHTDLHIVFDPETPFSERNFKIYLMFNSIRNIKRAYFIALTGRIEISRKKFEEGIIQMRFDLGFQSEEDDPKGMQTWQGKILTKIE